MRLSSLSTDFFAFIFFAIEHKIDIAKLQQGNNPTKKIEGTSTVHLGLPYKKHGILMVHSSFEMIGGEGVQHVQQLMINCKHYIILSQPILKAEIQILKLSPLRKGLN